MSEQGENEVEFGGVREHTRASEILVRKDPSEIVSGTEQSCRLLIIYTYSSTRTSYS